jgi:predicted RNase H-like HicB family nuclease
MGLQCVRGFERDEKGCAPRRSKNMVLYTLIEEWPDESLVCFRELPGCFSTAPTTEEAGQKAPEAIADSLRWLKQENIFFLAEEVSSLNMVVKERLRGDQIGPCAEALLDRCSVRRVK